MGLPPRGAGRGAGQPGGPPGVRPHQRRRHSNVVETARLFGCHSVAMASSSSVYGDRQKASGAEDTPGDEDALAADGELVHAFRETDLVVHPASLYAATKAGCELLVYTFHALYRLPVTCLRFLTVYGPRGPPRHGPAEVHGLDLPGPADRPVRAQQCKQGM